MRAVGVIGEIGKQRFRLAGAEAGDHPVGLYYPQPAVQLALPGSLHCWATRRPARIRRAAEQPPAPGTTTTIAVTGQRGVPGDNGPATKARLDHPWGSAIDAAGNVFFADNANARVRKVSPDGIITTYAGT